MEDKKLYLIVFESRELEVQWFLRVVDNQYVSSEDERLLVEEYLQMNHEMSLDELEDVSIWGNAVTEQDGYTVSLHKK